MDACITLLSRLGKVNHLASFQFEVDGRGNRINTREIVARPSTVTTTIDRNHASVSYTGTWSDTGGFRRTTEFSARLSLTLSGQELRLVVGTGPDHGRCDVYVDGSLWETYDGYSPAAGERRLSFYLDKGGSHSLELRNRPDKQTAASGFVVRFKQVDVLATTYDSQSLRYEYDALARLRLADYHAGLLFVGTPTRRYLYAFDLSGNRTQQSLSLNGGTPTTTNYTYNAANQLTSGGATYDANGNMLNDGTNAYTWDRANRLLSMGGASYAYDGEGRRVQQTIGAQVTNYLLDLQPGLAVVLSATQGANVERYVHGPTGIFARKDSSNVWHWTEQDALGTVRGEVDAFGGVEGTRTLDPFGNLIGSVNGTIGTPYGFTGEETDGTGQVYLRNRYYNPNMGVFPSLDPFEGMAGRPMSLNGYTWVEGNVANAGDPSGMCLTKEQCNSLINGNISNNILQALGCIMHGDRYGQLPITDLCVLDCATYARNTEQFEECALRCDNLRQLITLDMLNSKILRSTVTIATIRRTTSCRTLQDVLGAISGDTSKDCESQNSSLGVIVVGGILTHDHFDGEEYKDKMMALSRIRMYDWIYVSGVGKTIIAPTESIGAEHQSPGTTLLRLPYDYNLLGDIAPRRPMPNSLRRGDRVYFAYYPGLNYELGDYPDHSRISVGSGTFRSGYSGSSYLYILEENCGEEGTPGCTSAGDSGGGHFDREGNLLGVLWGALGPVDVPDAIINGNFGRSAFAKAV